ncbi:MAG TPA: GAF domain-containing protein [Coleofasciculaceae cyanobacterium]
MQKPVLPNCSLSLDLESVLRRMVHRIRRSLELQDILSATAAEVRSFLASDRVKIYQFNADGSGEVVAEAIHQHRLPSLLGLTFPADDIPDQARKLFIEARVRSVVNVESRLIGQSPLRDPETGEVGFSELQFRPLDPCHAEYLTAMGVKSSVVLPIFHQEQLWGLLVAHHSEPREIPTQELWALQTMVDQLSVAIAQSILLTQARQRTQREATINRIITLLHSLHKIELQAALEEAVSALQGVGGRLYINTAAISLNDDLLDQPALIPSRPAQLYTTGKQPVIPAAAPYALMEEYSVWPEHFQADGPQLWMIPDLYQEPSLRNLQLAFRPTSIRSVLMLPLWHRQQCWGYLSIFRDAIDTEILWAGKLDTDQRQLYPRLSFELWCETKQGQIYEWTADDLEMAQSLGNHFASAVQQYEMHQRLQALNTNLEKQVRERTSKLEQSAEQQRILFEVVAKMRQSLDLDTIFQTTTQEVCELLHADRVAVYQFNADWGGEFVGSCEFTQPDWVNSTKLERHTVWNDSYLQETQGGRFRSGETYVVNDILKAPLSSCHLEALEQYHIRAFLLAPIFVGQTLWGLLATYQHSGSRDWQSSEIQFAVQVAAQLGVAMEQAQLLLQTRQQAQQLAQALQDLQHAQAQLIQTEKMSSLGQLVAGVAHEINNPVNFIYGNLSYLSQYAKDLLELLNLYQQKFPDAGSDIRDRTEAIDMVFLAEDLPRILASMEIGTERIRQIVASLRNFSRHDQAETKPVDIHEGIDSTLMILHHRFTKPNGLVIEIVKEYGELPQVECYAGQLNQVLMNVLSNAIDSLEDAWNACEADESEKLEILKPQISIRTQVLESNRIAIDIADNGMGMDEAVQHHLFDPFFTTKPVGSGTGLGLSISYQIVVEKHKGSMRCISTPGQGAKFVIEIPIEPKLAACSAP